jgi:hypothetical protein
MALTDAGVLGPCSTIGDHIQEASSGPAAPPATTSGSATSSGVVVFLAVSPAWNVWVCLVH